MYDQINIDPRKRLKKYIRVSLIALFVIVFLVIPLFFIEFLDADFSMVRTGEIKWHLPKEFVQGNTDFVKIRLKYDVEVAKWEDTNTENELDRDTIQAAEIMNLRLVSSKSDGRPHFEIQPNEYQEQVIDTSRFGENHWEWEVTPILDGQAELILQQKIMIPTEEGLKPKQNPLKSQQVFIEKRLAYQVKSFFRNNWGWLMTAIIIPLWIYFYSNLKKTVKKKIEIDDSLKAELKSIDNSVLKTLKDGILNLIQKDETASAIDRIIEFSKEENTKELENQISLISSRFKSNEQEYRLNTISNSDYGMIKSQITKGILLLISEISEVE